MSAYFITGTGTGIGKTFTTCALIHAARTQKKEIHAYKPVICGYEEDVTSDTRRIIDALGKSDAPTVSPWRFKAPLSPDMAARREGKNLEVNALAEWTNKISGGGNLCLIETVGGVMVPLNATHTTRDWIASCKLPVILVAGSYLGTLSHTLSTLEALRAARIPVAALIVNESEASTVDLNETRDSIAAHARDIALIRAQPRVSSASEATVIHSLLEQLR